MPDFIKQNPAPNPETPRPQPEQPETAITPERPETRIETPQAPEKQAETPGPAAPVVAGHVISATERVEHPANKSEELHAIENIMAGGLEEIYKGLDHETQQRVKTEGEATAGKIENLLATGTDVAKKILHLIRSWLEKIPGVNRFFLEQESKIKTDKIMAMRREE